MRKTRFLSLQNDEEQEQQSTKKEKEQQQESQGCFSVWHIFTTGSAAAAGKENPITNAHKLISQTNNIFINFIEVKE